MESIGFDINELENMKRPQLQKLCKKFGIKANSKTSQLISDLTDYAKLRSAEENTKTPESNHASCLTVEPERPESTNKTSDKESVTMNSEEPSYKQQLMQHLEKKVEETLKQSKIPRLMDRNVTFCIGSTPPTLSQSKKKEHPAFKKMDSIDVYLEKKRKRTQTLYANMKKAKDVANTARSIVADMKASHNTPARESPKRIRRSTFNIDKSGNMKVPNSFSFGHLKSPKIIKPVCGQEKTKTSGIASRKSMSSHSKTKENKTPFESRKSIAVTPFRYNAGLENANAAGSVSAKKKFDLQASLSKPLTYKPHKGKIEKFPYISKDSKIPVKVNRKPLVDHKVDVKNVKVTSRVERRQNNRRSRADKRHNTMLARRGLLIS